MTFDFLLKRSKYLLSKDLVSLRVFFKHLKFKCFLFSFYSYFGRLFRVFDGLTLSVKIRLERVPFSTKRQLESVSLQNLHNLQYMGDLRLGSQQMSLRFIFDTVFNNINQKGSSVSSKFLRITKRLCG